MARKKDPRLPEVAVRHHISPFFPFPPGLFSRALSSPPFENSDIGPSLRSVNGKARTSKPFARPFFLTLCCKLYPPILLSKARSVLYGCHSLPILVAKLGGEVGFRLCGVFPTGLLFIFFFSPPLSFRPGYRRFHQFRFACASSCGSRSFLNLMREGCCLVLAFDASRFRSPQLLRGLGERRFLFPFPAHAMIDERHSRCSSFVRAVFPHSLFRCRWRLSGEMMLVMRAASLLVYLSFEVSAFPCVRPVSEKLCSLSLRRPHGRVLRYCSRC